MSKRFDATTKAITETVPADWVPFIGRRADEVDLVDAEVSTITASADRVIRVRRGDLSWLLQIELQASRDPDLVWRLVRYSGLLTARYKLPVLSLVV